MKVESELYRSTFEQAAIGVVHVSPSGEYLRVNQRFCDIHGYEPGELLGRKFLELTYSEDLPVILENHQKLVNGEIPSFRMEKRNLRKDGTIVWVNVTASLARNSMGKVDYVLAIIEDISLRKIAEDSLQIQHQYEMLYSGLSSSFINLPAGEVDQAIIEGLKRIADTMDFDRISIMQLSHGAPGMLSRYTYSTPEAPSLDTPLIAQMTSRFVDAIQYGESMIINRVEDLSSTSQEERQLFREMGMKSHAAIPLKVGGEILGFLGVNSFRREGVFTEAVIQQLHSLGEIFANALARKRAEEILTESEARYRSLFNDTPIALWEVDGSQLKQYIDHLRISGVDDLEEYLDEHPDELDHFTSLPMVMNVNRATLDLYHAEDLNEFQSGLTKIFDEDPYQVLKRGIINQAEGQNAFESEAVNFSLSGEKLIVHMKWSIPPGHEKTWDKVIISIVDITKRKKVEEELERLLTQVREIINTVPEGVLLLDSSKRVVLANPVADNYLEQLGDIKAGGCLKTLGDEPIEKLLTLPVQGLWHEVKAKGRIFEIVARSAANHAESERWVMVIRDVTQEREIQRSIQQQERLVAVGQMAAGIAHDFNNTLAVIILYAEMLLATAELAPPQKEKLNIIAQQANHGSYLVQQILDFSRRSVLERHPMDLLPFLKEQAKMFERTLPENINIKLNYLVDEYLVNADPTRMQQAIINLAVNARDAMQDGGELTISLFKPELGTPFSCVTCGPVREGEWVCVSVKDTGSGISTDVLSHIFEPFYTTKMPGKGIGLGLAQVYGIFKQHDGHVGVISRVGYGSTFYLYLPAFPIKKPDDFTLEENSLPRGHQETILVVEDESTTSEALLAGLTLLNYRVYTVHDGEEALLFLDEHDNKVDMILSDVVMPYMGGIALFNSMRERELKIPLVLMSGHPMQTELEEMQTKGLFTWIQKPASLKQLARIISEALQKPVT